MGRPVFVVLVELVLDIEDHVVADRTLEVVFDWDSLLVALNVDVVSGHVDAGFVEREREAYEMTQEMSITEAAEEMDVTFETVKTYLSQGSKKRKRTQATLDLLDDLED